MILGPIIRPVQFDSETSMNEKRLYDLPCSVLDQVFFIDILHPYPSHQTLAILPLNTVELKNYNQSPSILSKSLNHP